MKLFFIDTNIFAHWLILSKMKHERSDYEDLWLKFKKIRPSYEFLEFVKNNRLENKFMFCTSSLAISEMFYALLDEYRCSRMYYDGVPLSKWPSVKDRFSLSEVEAKDVTNVIRIYLNEFDIFEPLKFERTILVLSTENLDYSIISRLVLEKKVRTHDAILLSEALQAECGYFVTDDVILRQKKIENINIISADETLRIIKAGV